jgi:translocation and assembly module TamB
MTLNSKVKWWINGIAGVIFIILCAIYLLIRPIVVQNLEPVLQEQAGSHINGSLSWDAMDLDPSLDLSFTNLVLKDEKGNEVLTTPSLTVGWTMSSLSDYLMRHKGVASVVKTVTVDTPVLTLTQKSDGTWNAADLIKPSSDSNNGVFTGKVVIHDGKASVKTTSVGDFDFSGLQGSFAWDADSHIKGDLSGTFLDTSFTGNLKYTDSNNLEVNVKTDPLSLSSLQPLLKQFPQVEQKLTLKEGTTQVTDAKIWKSDGTVAYRVTGSFNHAALGYDDYVLTDGAAFFNIENGNVDVTKLSAKVNGQKVTGEIHVNASGDTPYFRGQAELHSLDIPSLLPDYDAAGTVDGSISFSGTTDHPSASGTVTLKDGSYQGLQVKKGVVTFSYTDGALSVPYLEADAAGGHVLGQGSYDKNSGDFSLQAEADGVDLAQMPLSTAVSGTLSGFCVAEGNYLDGSLTLHRASGNGDLSGFSYDGMSAGSFSGFGSYTDGNWSVTGYGQDLSYSGMTLDHGAFSLDKEGEVIHIPYASGLVGDGAFFVKGFYSHGGMDLDAMASDIDLSTLSGIVGEDLAGNASFSGHVTGTLDHPEGQGALRARNGHVRNASFDSVDGKVSFGSGNLNIESMKWQGASGNYEITGTIGMAAPHSMNLSVKTNKTRIESLLSLADLHYPVTGWMNNELTLTGTLDDPEVTGDFSAWSGSVMGQLFQSISGRYTYKNHELTLTDGLGYIYDGTVVVSGKAGEANGLDFTVSLTDISIEQLLPGKGVKGIVSLNGKVSDTFDSPRFDGTASTRSITIGDNTLRDVSTGIHYRDNVVSLDEGSFRQKQGTFLWKGSYNLSDGALSGYLDFNGWNIKNIMTLLKQPADGVDGTVEGGMRISGTLDNPNVDFRAHLLGGHLGDAVLGEGNIDFSYMNKALSIRKFYIPIGDGVLAAQGQMTTDGSLNIQAAARDMDVSWIPQALGKKDMSIGGKLTAALNLSGTRDNPVADLSVGLDHPRYGDITFDNFSLMANASNNVVTLQNALLQRGTYRASMKGTMPVNFFTRNTEDKAVPMDLDINLDQADMNMLALFAKPVTSASGPIQGHVKVAGSWDNPMLLGGITVKDGVLTVKTLNESVQPINLSLTLSGYTAALDGSASFGGGSLTTKGNLSWDHYKLGQYNGELHIHTPAIDDTYYKGSLDGDFTLGEVAGFNKPGVEGTLKIQDAVIDIPFSLLGDSGTSSLDFLTKINVQVGENVRLYNSALYDMTIHGNIGMMGPFSDPVMSGRVNVDKGTVKINTSEFKMDQANAVWGEEPGSLLPSIHAKAFTKVGHYEITAQLEGPVGNMKTTFHSDPALNDSQILMLLTLHQDPNNKDNNGAMEGALFNAGLTMIFGNGIQDFLQDKIGLDLISITSSLTDYYDNVDDNNDSYYYIKIGKYLFNDFMLTATMGMNNDEKSVGAHYDLDSRVGLSSWYNSNHDSYVGTDWSFKF